MNDRNTTLNLKQSKNFENKGFLNKYLSLFETYPATSIVVIIFSIMGLISLSLFTNIDFIKVMIGMIFPIFLFFTIESRYFNVKFENKKDSRSLKFWHYMFGLTVSLIFILLFFIFFTYGGKVIDVMVNTNPAGEVKVSQQTLEYPNLITQYALMLFSLILFLFGLLRIKNNLNLSETDYLQLTFKKYIKILMIIFGISILDFLLSNILTSLKIDYSKFNLIKSSLFYLILPIVIYPAVLNSLISIENKSRNHFLKKIIIYFIAPISIITTVVVGIAHTIISPNISDFAIYFPCFIFITLIGVVLKEYLKDYAIDKNKETKEKEKEAIVTVLIKDKNETEDQEENTDTDTRQYELIHNERERKYIKLLSDLVLLPMVILTILPVYLIIKEDTFETGINAIDFYIALFFLIQGILILFYCMKDHDLAKRLVSYTNFLIITVVVGIGYWAMVKNMFVLLYPAIY